MERVYCSNSRPLTEACHLLFTITIGLISFSAIAVLTYFTYEATAGNMSYSTLWIDIPILFAIFLFFYYAAGVCGILPECCLIKCLPQPLILYKLESWRWLFECLSESCTFNYQDSEISFSDNPETPLLQQRSAKNIPISITATHETVKPPSPEEAARNRHTAIASSSSKYSSYVDLLKAKIRYYMPRNLSESSLTSTESSDISERSTSPTFVDLDSSLPNYPRFPWSFLKYEDGVPKEALALHKQHLMREKQEIERYKKKQRVEETLNASKDNEHEWITGSDDFNPTASRPIRLSSNLPRRKISFRGRSRKNTTAGVRKFGKSKIQIRRRANSNNVSLKTYASATTKMGDNPETYDQEQEVTKFSENSPNSHAKVDCIERNLMTLERSYPGSGEASTSEPNRDVSSSKTSSITVIQAEPTNSPNKSEDEAILLTSPEI